MHLDKQHPRAHHSALPSLQVAVRTLTAAPARVPRGPAPRRPYMRSDDSVVARFITAPVDALVHELMDGVTAAATAASHSVQQEMVMEVRDEKHSTRS